MGKKTFVEHVQDRVDWLGIMSYRRDPSEIVKLVATELNYARILDICAR